MIPNSTSFIEFLCNPQALVFNTMPLRCICIFKLLFLQNTFSLSLSPEQPKFLVAWLPQGAEKHSLQVLVHVDMITSRNWCRFVGCIFMLRISRSTTSQSFTPDSYPTTSILQRKSRFVRPGDVFPIFNCPVLVSLGRLLPQFPVLS